MRTDVAQALKPFTQIVHAHSGEYFSVVNQLSQRIRVVIADVSARKWILNSHFCLESFAARCKDNYLQLNIHSLFGKHVAQQSLTGCTATVPSSAASRSARMRRVFFLNKPPLRCHCVSLHLTLNTVSAAIKASSISEHGKCLVLIPLCVWNKSPCSKCAPRQTPVGKTNQSPTQSHCTTDRKSVV